MFDIAYAVTERGDLAVLRSNCDVNGNWVRNRALGHHGHPVLTSGALASVSLFDGAVEGSAIEFPLEYPAPKLDHLPDGCWLLANSRCPVGETNAQLLSPDGAVLRRFCLGDGINHLQCDATGAIWAGYFDEGVFGNNGWGLLSGPEPIGASGLVKFDTHGAVLWRFDGQATGEKWIVDCYALNVNGSNAWAYYYTDFPIVEIGAKNNMRHWRCPVGGAKALAVGSGAALLFGGYNENKNRLVLLDLEAEAARICGEFRLDIPEVAVGRASLLQARGDVVHIIRERNWMRVSVPDVRAFAAAAH